MASLTSFEIKISNHSLLIVPQKSLDHAIFSHILFRKAQMSGGKASITLFVTSNIFLEIVLDPDSFVPGVSNKFWRQNEPGKKFFTYNFHLQLSML